MARDAAAPWSPVWPGHRGRIVLIVRAMNKISAIGENRFLGSPPLAGLLAATAGSAMALELSGLGVVRDFIKGLPYEHPIVLKLSLYRWSARPRGCVRTKKRPAIL